jgi:hypothetical protein
MGKSPGPGGRGTPGAGTACPPYSRAGWRCPGRGMPQRRWRPGAVGDGIASQAGPRHPRSPGSGRCPGPGPRSSRLMTTDTEGSSRSAARDLRPGCGTPVRPRPGRRRRRTGGSPQGRSPANWRPGRPHQMTRSIRERGSRRRAASSPKRPRRPPDPRRRCPRAASKRDQATCWQQRRGGRRDLARQLRSRPARARGVLTWIVEPRLARAARRRARSADARCRAAAGVPGIAGWDRRSAQRRECPALRSDRGPTTCPAAGQSCPRRACGVGPPRTRRA